MEGAAFLGPRRKAGPLFGYKTERQDLTQGEVSPPFGTYAIHLSAARASDYSWAKAERGAKWP